MQLQNEILLKYRTKFPKETLRQTSTKTGIQVTRLHRIYQGKEMKLSEYQVFVDALGEQFDDQSGVEILELSKTCLAKLSHRGLQGLKVKMESLLARQSIKEAGVA